MTGCDQPRSRKNDQLQEGNQPCQNLMFLKGCKHAQGTDDHKDDHELADFPFLELLDLQLFLTPLFFLIFPIVQLRLLQLRFIPDVDDCFLYFCVQYDCLGTVRTGNYRILFLYMQLPSAVRAFHFNQFHSLPPTFFHPNGVPAGTVNAKTGCLSSQFPDQCLQIFDLYGFGIPFLMQTH